MFLTLRANYWATSGFPFPPLYTGTRLTDAVAAAIRGSSESNTAVFWVEEERSVTADLKPLFTVAHDNRQEWHDKRAEAECNQRAIQGLKKTKPPSM